MISEYFSLARTVVTGSRGSVIEHGFNFPDENKGRSSYSRYLTFHLIPPGVDPKRTLLITDPYIAHQTDDSKFKVVCQVLLTPKTVKMYNGALDIRDLVNPHQRIGLLDKDLRCYVFKGVLVGPDGMTAHWLTKIKDDARVIILDLGRLGSEPYRDVSFERYYEMNIRAERQW